MVPPLKEKKIKNRNFPFFHLFIFFHMPKSKTKKKIEKKRLVQRNNKALARKKRLREKARISSAFARRFYGFDVERKKKSKPTTKKYKKKKKQPVKNTVVAGYPPRSGPTIISNAFSKQNPQKKYIDEYSRAHY